jgi:glycosyltransferase involved in cell wall biosynthesis
VVRLAVLGATHPLTSGAAQFNAAMVTALRRRAPTEFISWRRLYPPLLYRGPQVDSSSQPARPVQALFLLDWADPRTWRRALREAEAFGAGVLVLPWLHPVMTPPYRWLLRHAPRRISRVVVCHNVLPHEPQPLARLLTRATLGHADLLVTHAPHQRGELEALGLGATPLLEAFHPRFVARDLAAPPLPETVRAERARLGDPDLLLLAYGAVRPYKGVDLALEALARVDPALRVKLVVAGRFWGGKAELEAQAAALGVRVELRDGYVSNEETALLFAACDAALLPYRSASQSGVVGLAFAHERPVLATAVGGLPAAVRDGRDGLLCPPDDPDALARAIERLAVEHLRLRAGVREEAERFSFDRYAELLLEAVA